MPKELSVPVGDGTVSALWERPEGARAALAIAHGAGAGMRHRFLGAVANGLAERGVATLRYQFPYMEAGRKSPGGPGPAMSAVRAAVHVLKDLAVDLPLFAGGKSYGGRMTSNAEAEAHLDGVLGLVFFGFPLHPPGKPSVERGAHLKAVQLPLLFLQGSRDDFADNQLIEGVVDGIGRQARLVPFEAADHSFHVTKASGTTDGAVMADVLNAVSAWIEEIVATAGQ